MTNSILSGRFYQSGGIVTKNIISDVNAYLEISGGDVGGVVSVGGRMNVSAGTLKDISCLSGSVTEITNVTMNGKITTNGLLTIDGETFNVAGEKSFFAVQFQQPK